MSKRKGNYNERKTIRYLEKIGYFCVKSGGSLGIFDIIAICKTGGRLIQVKTNRNAGPEEREQIELFKEVPSNFSKEIWIWKDYERTPIVSTL